jgi:hypothetical protein
MTGPSLRTAGAVAILLWIVAAADLASAEEFVSDFQTGFDGWQQQWHESEPPGGSDGVVTHTTSLGYLDSASLMFDMGNGAGDDGTLWIEKQFAVSPTVPTNISVTFQLFSPEQSDFNNFEVKAVISTENPEVQPDFVTIGETNMAAGWVPYAYGQTITAPSGQVWVALGIRVAFESPRTYWIDHVTVSTNPIPEPTTAPLGVAAILALATWWPSRSAR